MNDRAITVDNFDLFSTEVKKRGAFFYVVCKKLTLIESDPSLELAYIKLDKKRREVAEEMMSLGINVFSDNHHDLTHMRSNWLSKTMQVSVIFMCLSFPISAGIGVLMVTKLSSNLLSRVEYKVKSNFASFINNPSQLSGVLNRVTAKIDAITPERKDEIRLSVRKIAKFVKPFASELKEITE